ncbi:MAG TPA: arylamine N-acetyltransferase [Candidatus Acidoferrales bacterium]|nr:arylamine N-acetyltransferase [Candidatus Acidoferrales bacterium]
MSLKLHRYLRRIKYGGPLSPTRQTLHNLHRAHLLAIPFENIDVQLGSVPSLDPERIFEKLVVRERGGWCFEMNLLFAWAIKQIGVRADLIGATVNRSKAIEGAPINHVALLVHLEQPYLADVGFGNGFLNPTPLREGTFNDGRFDFKLTSHGKYWRFYNHRENGASYDFTGEPVDLATIEAANRSLATTSESPFVQTLVCSQLTEEGMVTLTNAALRIFSPKHMNEESASSHESFQRVLREHFGLEIERSEALWARVADQHKRWLRKRIRGF